MKKLNPEIFKKYLESKTDDIESALVKKYLEANNISEKDITKMLEYREEIKLFEQIKPEEDWQIIHRRLFNNNKTENLKLILKVAASVILLAGLFSVLMNLPELTNQSYSFSNNSNLVDTIVLPDSSLLFLSKGATIKYYARYKKNRNLFVNGKTYFEVRRNMNNPFVIRTGNCGIKVLGTSFMVNSNQKDVEVIVTSGKVALYKTNKFPDTIYLVKGERGLYGSEPENIKKEKNDEINYLSWQNHRLIFSNTPIEKVIKDLEEYFKVNIILDKNVPLSIRFTSEFRKPRLSVILKELKLALNLQNNKSGNLILISAR